MIDVSGDVIYFEGRPVGFIIIPNGTMRDRFEVVLEMAGDSSIEEELERELSQAQDKIDSAVAYIENNEEPSIDEILKILS